MCKSKGWGDWGLIAHHIKWDAIIFVLAVPYQRKLYDRRQAANVWIFKLLLLLLI